MSTKGLEATLAALTPAIIGYREELPYVSPEKVASKSITHFRFGGPELILIFKAILLVLNALSLLKYRRFLKNLDTERQSALLEKCSTSRFIFMRGLTMLLKIPVAMHYYSQDEVCLALGYDREALCADADKHQVTR